MRLLSACFAFILHNNKYKTIYKKRVDGFVLNSIRPLTDFVIISNNILRTLVGLLNYFSQVLSLGLIILRLQLVLLAGNIYFYLKLISLPNATLKTNSILFYFYSIRRMGGHGAESPVSHRRYANRPPV